MTLDLGRKLAANLEKTKEELIRTENLKKEKENSKIKQNRDSFRSYFESILQRFENEIEDGLVPNNVTLRSSGRNQFLSEIINSISSANFLNTIKKSIYSDIYEDVVVAWEKKNNVSLTFKDQHDGGGMESWLEINLKPSHQPEAVLTKNPSKILKR